MNQQTSSQNLKILVADRHIEIRKSISEVIHFFSKRVLNISVCSTDAELIEAVEKLQPDVLIIEVALLKSDILVFSRNMETKFPKTRIIAITLFDRCLVRDRIKYIESLGYWEKTMEVENLIALIDNVSSYNTQNSFIS